MKWVLTSAREDNELLAHVANIFTRYDVVQILEKDGRKIEKGPYYTPDPLGNR